MFRQGSPSARILSTVAIEKSRRWAFLASNRQKSALNRRYNTSCHLAGLGLLGVWLWVNVASHFVKEVCPLFDVV